MGPDCGWRDAEDFPGTLLPPNAHSVCLPHPGWCSAPIHPQRVDGTSKGNFDTSASRRCLPRETAERQSRRFRRA